MSRSKDLTFELILTVDPDSDQVPVMLELPGYPYPIPTRLKIGSLPCCPLAALAGEDEEKEVRNV